MSIPHGPYLDTCVLLSFLKLWILFSICTVISPAIVSSGRVYEKYLKRKLQVGVRLQAIFLWKYTLYVLYCFLGVVGSHSKPRQALL